MCCVFFFFFKQKTAYEIRKGDWSSDVCSSDLRSSVSPRPARCWRGRSRRASAPRAWCCWAGLAASRDRSRSAAGAEDAERRSERRSSAGLAGALEFWGFALARERFPRPRRGPSRPPPTGWLRLLLDRREHALGRERRAPHPRAGRREDRVRQRGEDRGRAGLAEARGVLG